MLNLDLDINFYNISCDGDDLDIDNDLTFGLNLSCLLFGSSLEAYEYKYDNRYQEVIDLIDEYLTFKRSLKVSCYYNFLTSLQHLKNQLPDHEETKAEIFQDWWINKSKVWSEQLRNILIQYRNIGHAWKFTDQQRKLLLNYYNANLLLVDCLNQASPEMRSHIEDTLLLPIEEIEKRPFKN